MNIPFESIGEPIQMAAVFTEDKKITPYQFRCRDRIHKGFQVTSTWKKPKGQFVKVFFTLYTGGQLYEVYFRSRMLRMGIAADIR